MKIDKEETFCLGAFALGMAFTALIIGSYNNSKNYEFKNGKYYIEGKLYSIKTNTIESKVK